MPFGGIGSFLPKFKPPAFPGENLKINIPGGGRISGSENRREILQLLARVQVIEQDCIEQNKKDEIEAENDEFIRLKRSLHQNLSDLKLLVRQRHDIQQAHGNTVEALKKTQKMNEIFHLLDSEFSRMKDVFKKQTKQRKTLGDAELDTRFQHMQVIKRQIEESRGLVKTTGQYTTEEVQTLTDFTSQMRREGIELAPQKEERALQDNEREALGRWAERDKKLDKGIEEIGDVVTRLGDIAVKIGETADNQAKIVESLNVQANEANDELLDVNNSIKNVLASGNGAGFCCKLVLALILVGELGYLISRINRYIQTGK